MDADPTDDELFALANALLRDLREGLKDPAVLREAIAQNREHWVLLYQVNRDLLHMEVAAHARRRRRGG